MLYNNKEKKRKCGSVAEIMTQCKELKKKTNKNYVNNLKDKK